MGVDYRPVLAVGKKFESPDEIVEFLEVHNLLSESEIEELQDEGDHYITEIFYEREGKLIVECLNLYTGYGYFIGFKLSPREPAKFHEAVHTAISEWMHIFGTEPDIIHTVRVS